MIDLIKELWFKWRARVYGAKVSKGDFKRLAIKETQLQHKAKSLAYKAKYNELNKL